MIGDNAQFDQFISDNRWGVITTLRKDGAASSSWIAYARDGDTLVVSTPGATFKSKSLHRNPQVTVCCTSEGPPFNFVTVEGRAEVTKDDLVEMTRQVFKAIEGSGFDEPEDLQGWLDSQDRVIIRVHPERVYGVIR